MSNPTPAGGLRKVRRATFVQVPSTTIRDAALSFRARGVLAFLLDHPDGWSVDAAYIAHHGTEGREAVGNALRELRAAGYYRLERRRTPGGRFVMGTAIAEEAQPEWAAAHAANAGGAVPVTVLADGTVVEGNVDEDADDDDPATSTDTTNVQVSTGNGFSGAGAVRSGERAANYLDRDTDSEEGGTLVGDVTRAPSPTPAPPSRTCRKVGPHGACGACATDREALAAYEAARATEDALIATARREAEAALARVARTRELVAVDVCDTCDADGFATELVDGEPVVLRCQHDAELNARTAHARMAAKAATPKTRAGASTRARRLAATGGTR